MSNLATQWSRAILVAMLCLGAGAAEAQVAPLRYGVPGGLFGFGGTSPAANGADSAAAGDAADWRANFPTGMFVRGDSGGVSLNGLGQAGAFGNFGALTYEGVQAGYAFKGVGGLPVTLFAGFDTLKYDSGGLRPLTPFSADAGPAAGYSANVGVEFRPTSNLSLSFGASYTQQQSGRLDSDINSRLLPGESPIFYGGRR